jgi:ammonium transporter, Amt family
LIEGSAKQLLIQLEGIVVVAAWCAALSFVILKIIDMTIGLRVSKDVEIEGLDLNLHGEVVP